MAVRLRLVAGVFLDECELRGKEGLSLLGIVDSGASPTYVTVEARRSAHLEPTGRSKTFMCVHGKNHAGIATRSYYGRVMLGTKSGGGIVYEIDAPLAVGGLRVGVVLGRDMLQHLNVALNWKDGTGFLEW